jgi:tetratricopeptide (TPR) repeat protein
MRRILISAVAVAALGVGAWAQQGQTQQQPKEESQQQAPQASDEQEPQGVEQLSPDLTFPEDRNTPPRSDESSSKQTKIDLRPPMGDAMSHPNSGVADEVMEMHVWDPHKAEKNVEVGDYYFKRKNFVAAAGRYREALKWKDNDAIATFKLAVASEKLGKLEDAREAYQSYLKILPNGPSAEESKKALEKLPKAPVEEKKIGELKTK